MRLALFDLDGTVLRGNSWHEFFWWTVRERPALAPQLLGLLALRRMRVIAGRTLREAALRSLRGMTRAEVMAVGRKVSDERLHPLIRAAARKEIARCAAAGFVPVLATGAFDFLAEPLAAELGVAEIVGTRLAYADERCLGRIAGAEARGEAKTNAVRERFLNQPVAWERSRAFSDAMEDAPLWSLVGEAWIVTGEATRPDGLPAAVRVVDWDTPDATG